MFDVSFYRIIESAFKNYLLLLSMRIITTFLVCEDNEFKILTKDDIPAQGEYVPLGKLLDSYWRLYSNNFPKITKVAQVLMRWPTTSTQLEREFSLISAQYDKRANRISTDTLYHLHNSSKGAYDFLKAVKATCREENISLDL